MSTEGSHSTYVMHKLAGEAKSPNKSLNGQSPRGRLFFGGRR